MTIEAMRIRLVHALGAAAAAAVAATAALVFVPGADAAITGSALVNPKSGKCLDASATQVVIQTCTGGASQSWTSTAANELRTSRGCLAASGGGTGNGTKLVIATCSGASSQKWRMNSNLTITGTPSGKCVDVFGNGTADGTIVELWSCKTAGNNNQRWTPSGGTPSPTPPPTGTPSPTPTGSPQPTCAVKSRPSGKVLQGDWENWDGASHGVHPG